ncbi:hypothetical protein CSB85_2207 [Pseudomonas aeruginosa]|nr:hypothetical protein CSB85_2207 [Pseudomonas aeruginosa]RAL77335.1 hypothetical protein CSC34_0378 [Pseudomonas aeruginosa]RCH32183.1 hypothetical protein CSC43_1006 [Pseudomonas aeruginosa]
MIGEGSGVEVHLRPPGSGGSLPPIRRGPGTLAALFLS